MWISNSALPFWDLFLCILLQGEGCEGEQGPGAHWAQLCGQDPPWYTHRNRDQVGGRWWTDLYLTLTAPFNIPDSNFFQSVSRIQAQKDSRIRIPIKNLSILTQKIVSKLSEIWSGMFIPDPNVDFLPISDPGVKQAPDPGVKQAPHPGPRSATLPFR
jgi:hypothetical protein